MIEICNRPDILIKQYEGELNYDKSWDFTIAHGKYCTEEDKRTKGILKRLYWVRDGGFQND